MDQCILPRYEALRKPTFHTARSLQRHDFYLEPTIYLVLNQFWFTIIRIKMNYILIVLMTLVPSNVFAAVTRNNSNITLPHG